MSKGQARPAVMNSPPAHQKEAASLKDSLKQMAAPGDNTTSNPFAGVYIDVTQAVELQRSCALKAEGLLLQL